MDNDGFWIFLERSAKETTNPRERAEWLEDRLSRISRTHIEDFQVNLNAARSPIDTYAVWGAANLIMDGLCSTDGFWYFQPWLIGQGRHWHERAIRDSDSLADVPAVRALAGRRSGEWTSAEWPQWEELAYVAPRAHERITGQEGSLYDALSVRGQRSPSDPHPRTTRGTSIASLKFSDACHVWPTCSPGSDTSRPEFQTFTKSTFLSPSSASPLE